MVVYDTVEGAVSLDVATAILSDIVAPSSLIAGVQGHITGYATNTGTTALDLIVELIDRDTGAVVTSAGPVHTIPQAPMFNFDLVFVMPNKTFNYEIRLRD